MTEEIRVEDAAPNPRNPRERFDEKKISELADSIADKGLLQPVLARPKKDGFELVHGERRLRAVKQLGQETIKADIRDLSDREALEISITENLQREEVSPIAEARSYQLLIDEFSLTQGEAADRLDKSQPHISSRLQLLDYPESLQQDILRKIFSPSQASELARVWGDYYLRDLALDWDLSVRQIRSIVDDLQSGSRRIAVERQLSSETLSEFWGYADADTEAQTVVEGAGESDVRVIPTTFVDSEGEPVERISEGEVTSGMLWAKRNLPTDRFDIYDGEFESERLLPIQIHWPAQKILFGYNRLMIADSEGYTGDFEVEMVWPAEFFEWDARVTKEVEA